MSIAIALAFIGIFGVAFAAILWIAVEEMTHDE